MPARLVERIGADPRLHAAADPVARGLAPLFQPPAVKRALSGAWLGHRLHPMLTDTVIGTWTSATLLDWSAGHRSGRSQERLIAIGLFASVPTALSGMSDWSETTGRPRAIGLVHAGGNVLASALFTASLAMRRRGKAAGGRWLGLAGMAVLGIGGYLGAHLSYVNGVGVDRTAYETEPSG